MFSTMTLPLTSPVVAFAPAEGVNADTFLDWAGDLGSLQTARPAVCDFRRLQVRIDAVGLESA